MRVFVLAAFAVLLFAIGGPPVVATRADHAAATAAPPASIDLTARRKARRPANDPSQIACTRFGCIRVPPHCHPEPDYRFDGLPADYDRIVCP